METLQTRRAKKHNGKENVKFLSRFQDGIEEVGAKEPMYSQPVQVLLNLIF